MKEKERNEARKLRMENGESVHAIAKLVGASVSSVSRWVKDIKLTEEQEKVLQDRVPTIAGPNAIRAKALLKRKTYQEEGKTLLNNYPIEFGYLCMLYWGEGRKNKNSFCLSNTDYNLLKVVVRLLKKIFNLKNSDFKLSVNWYSSGGNTLEDIHKFWCNELGLSSLCFTKCFVDVASKYSQKRKGNIHPYGTRRVSVHDTRIVQQIFGAIQEIGCFKNDTWIS
jgi:transposase-like protein